ncbi:MAG: hypothetical protein RL168_500, partial [Bacteroidota bacterium]
QPVGDFLGQVAPAVGLDSVQPATCSENAFFRPVGIDLYQLLQVGVSAQGLAAEKPGQRQANEAHPIADRGGPFLFKEEVEADARDEGEASGPDVVGGRTQHEHGPEPRRLPEWGFRILPFHQAGKGRHGEEEKGNFRH